MCKNIILSILMVIFCSSSLIAEESLKSEPIPTWVERVEIPTEFIAPKKDQVNLQALLSDQQQNWKERTIFFNFALKALNQIGVEGISRIQISYDPSFEEVQLHTIRVFRDGEWQDRMSSAHHRVIQKEERLEQGMTDGNQTLVIFLEDVREGDIVEYSYSIEGESPLFGSHLTLGINFQNRSTAEKRTFRLISTPDHFIEIKPFNGAVDPLVVDSGSDQREWKWSIEEVEGIKRESRTPTWYRSDQFVQISQYQNWGEVISALLPLYQLTDEVEEKASSSMKKKIEEWMEMDPSSKERALAALRFMQDEVRYVHLGEGIGSHKPRDPLATFESRFGDCKDKSVLLSVLLKMMGIDSNPVLVNTNRGKILDQYLPSPYAFNHVILCIKIDGMSYFVDPTLSLQGGDLDHLYLPNYYFGLVISKENTDLISLPHFSAKMPIEYLSEIEFSSDKTAKLKVIASFFEDEAESVRRVITTLGKEEFSKKIVLSSLIQDAYRGADYLSPLVIEDDREMNRIQIVGEYEVPLKKTRKGMALNISSLGVPFHFQNGMQKDRKMPYALNYPLWVKEEIRVKNPSENWNIDSEVFEVVNDYISFNFSSEIDEKSAVVDLEFKHLADHVPIDCLEEYYDIIDSVGLYKMTELPVSNN